MNAHPLLDLLQTALIRSVSESRPMGFVEPAALSKVRWTLSLRRRDRAPAGHLAAPQTGTGSGSVGGVSGASSSSRSRSSSGVSGRRFGGFSRGLGEFIDSRAFTIDLLFIRLAWNHADTTERSILISNVTLEGGTRSLFDADGSSIVIHAGKDDYTSDPAGKSGDRIACGRIVR